MTKAQQMLSNYEDEAAMFQLGACGTSSGEGVVFSLKHFSNLDTFLAQDRNDRSGFASAPAKGAQLCRKETE